MSRDVSSPSIGGTPEPRTEAAGRLPEGAVCSPAESPAVRSPAVRSPAGPAPRASATIDNIQTLRALAALLVVFVHLDVFLRALGLAPFGHGGVDLFFVISGFIMVHTTGRAPAVRAPAVRARPISPASFLVNRFTRIAPIYWLITLFVYGVALAAPSLLQATSTAPEQLAKSLFFIPFQKANGLVQPTLFVGWTLNYEMFFYALFAVGLAFPKRPVGAALVAAFMVALVAFGSVVRPESVLGAFYTRPIILEFVAGMALGAIGAGVCVPVRWKRGLLLGACALGLAAVAFVPLLFPGLSRLVTQGVPAVAVVAGAIVLHQSGVRVGGRWLLLLGDASYALYLTHPFVTQAAQKAGKLLGLTPLLAASLIPVTLVLVCLVGVVTHLVVERPLTRLAKGLLERLPVVSSRPAPAPGLARFD